MKISREFKFFLNLPICILPDCLPAVQPVCVPALRPTSTRGMASQLHPIYKILIKIYPLGHGFRFIIHYFFVLSLSISHMWKSWNNVLIEMLHFQLMYYVHHTKSHLCTHNMPVIIILTDMTFACTLLHYDLYKYMLIYVHLGFSNIFAIIRLLCHFNALVIISACYCNNVIVMFWIPWRQGQNVNNYIHKYIIKSKETRIKNLSE